MNPFTSLVALSLLLASSTLPLSLQAKSPASDLSQQEKPATLRILLIENSQKIFLEVKGGYFIFNRASGFLVDSSLSGKRADLFSTSSGLKWGELLPATESIRIVPKDAKTTILLNGIQYKGCMDIISENNTLSAINELDVEHYLQSTLNPKFPEKLPDEAMEAVAIAARTNAYYFISQNRLATWHVRASNVGYQGYATSLQNVYVDRAIERSKQMILTYQDKPFPAFWTEDSAGKTTNFSVVFRQESLAPKGVSSPIAAHDRSKHQWNLALTKTELAKIANTSRVTGVDLFRDQDSGKIYAIRVKNGKETCDIPFAKFQQLVGKEKLVSNDFTIASKKDHIIITGYGKGLGMGLCLYSAKKMAENGQSSQQILETFFPGTQLKNQKTLP